MRYFSVIRYKLRKCKEAPFIGELLVCPSDRIREA